VRQDTAKALTDGLNTLTASAGVGSSAWGMLEYWDFINTNAAGIGVLLTFFFGIIAFIFNIYNSSKLSVSGENAILIDELREEITRINESANS